MNARGQALIELVTFVMIGTGLVTAFLGFTTSFLIRQELLLAAREGMLLYSSGRFTTDEVRGRLTIFLTAGSPALRGDRLDIRMGRAQDLPSGPIAAIQARLIGLDYITIRYTSPSRWLRALNLNPILEETCYIKHANSYGPSIPALWGPPVHS